MEWKPKDFEHGLCSICKKYGYCDMVEDMGYEGDSSLIYKEECGWFRLSDYSLKIELEKLKK